MTKVIFRKLDDGSIMAVFPDIPSSSVHSYLCTGYMHIGQHSQVHYAHIVSTSVPAQRFEYEELLNELRAIGYDDLVIYKDTNTPERG